MKKNSYKFFLKAFVFVLFSLMLAGFTPSAKAAGLTAVTVRLVDSAGAPISGAQVIYTKGPNANNGWYQFGTTDANGLAVMNLPSNSTSMIQVKVGVTQSTQTVTIGTTPVTAPFQTSKINVESKTCAGKPVNGVYVIYASNVNNGWYEFGTTGADGKTSKELFPSSLKFTAKYLATETQKDATVSNGSVVSFPTTNVTINSSESVVYYRYHNNNNGYYNFSKPSMELMPGTYSLKVGQNGFYDISFSGCSYTASFATVRLIDSAGKGIAGATAQYYDGSWKNIPGTTDVNGNLYVTLSGAKTTYPFSLSYNGATQRIDQNIATNSIVTFQTKKVTVSLTDSKNAPLSGVPQFYAGKWQTFGNGTTNSSMELLPGSYPFTVTYLGASQRIDQNIASNPNVAFQTKLATVSLLASDGVTPLAGTAQFYAGKWQPFGATNSSVELLPVTYPFTVTYKGASQRIDQNIASNPNVAFQTKLATVSLLASDGVTPLAGTAQFYAGTWQPFGATNSSVELLPITYPFTVTYKGASQRIDQNIATNPNVAFQTKLATVSLLASDGVTPLAGTAQFYAGTWQPFGATNSSVELLPITYPFTVTYKGASQRIDQNIASNPNVAFQTKLATVSLLASDGVTPLAGTAQFYAGTWQPFGATNSSVELLPITYPFTVTYKGASQRIDQNIASNPNVAFQTKLATVSLLASDGVTPLAGTAQFYAGTWQPFGATNSSVELLPITYPFTVTYKGASQRIDQNIASNPNVAFKTAKVTMSYAGIDGVQIPAQSSFYAGKWQTFGSGTTQTTDELLPVTYPFTITYEGETQRVDQNVGVNPNVVFTPPVTVQLLDSTGKGIVGATAQYYDGTGGWKTITGSTGSNGKLKFYLTPNGKNTNFAFRVNYKGAYQEKWQDLKNGMVVSFQTKKVAFNFNKSDGSAVTGTAQFYTGSGSWQTFGTGSTNSTMELLPVNYAFRVSYFSAYQEKWQNTANNANVEFKTVPVAFNFNKSDGSAVAGTAQFYTGAGTWQSFGNGSTNSTMELLPVNYAFRVSYLSAYQEKWQNTANNANVEFKTVPVAFNFNKSDGSAVTGTAQFYTGSGSWQTFGTGSTNSTMELLPVNYAFRVSYFSAYQEKWQNTASNANVEFKTVPVAFNFNKSDGSAVAGTAQFYTGAGTWQSFGNGSTNSTMELLPVNYAFRVSYLSAYQEKWQNTANNANVEFKTVPVAFNFNKSDGSAVAGTAQFYTGAGTWQSFGNGSTNSTMELLPVNYAFRVSYLSAYQEKWQNTANNANVEFKTVPVAFNFNKSDGSAVTGTAQFYTGSGSWQTFGTGSTNSTMELLPVNYAFRVSYLSAYQEKWQNTASNANVEFKTVPVAFNFNKSDGSAVAGTAQFYTGAGTWQSFGNGSTGSTMELLPVNYAFRVSYFSAYQEKWQNTASNANVEFKTVPVAFNLYAADGVSPLTGAAQFYTGAGTWQSFGNGSTGSTMELLPVNYAFRYSYQNEAKDKWQNVGNDTNVTFVSAVNAVVIDVPEPETDAIVAAIDYLNQSIDVYVANSQLDAELAANLKGQSAAALAAYQSGDSESFNGNIGNMNNDLYSYSTDDSGKVSREAWDDLNDQLLTLQGLGDGVFQTE